MQIKNNYDILSKKLTEAGETTTGIFNGELGIITSIDNIEKQIVVNFADEKIASYSFSELDQLEHAYAITVHKSQGSEFAVVVMVVPETAPMLLTRNLLYTGITRARELLIILGSEKTVNFMIKNVDNKKRNTGLKYKLTA
jgi:exodeoxyribonuclease V alpha subunit